VDVVKISTMKELLLKYKKPIVIIAGIIAL